MSPLALGELVGSLTCPTKFNGILTSIVPLWSAASIRSRLPGKVEVTVEYSIDGMYRPRPDVNAGRYFRKRMPADEALSRIVFNREFGCYVYASEVDLDEHSPYFAGLVPELRDSQRRLPTRRLLFIGGSGTGTHTHYDLPDNLMLILAGRKSIAFFSPEVSKWLRPFASPLWCCNVSSLKDSEVMALLPLLDSKFAFEIDVEEGDAVYVPSGWWHRVKNHEFSAGVSNFWMPSLRRRVNWHSIRVRIARSRIGKTIGEAILRKKLFVPVWDRQPNNSD